MTSPTVPTQLSEIWRTRPVRLPDHGPGAGVAAGIAHRYRVDPVLVRVAFAVSALFGGAGIVLYLAAWLVLPRIGDTVSPADSLLGRGRGTESHATAVVLAVAVLIAVFSTGPLGGGSGLVSTAAMLGGLYLLHRRTPNGPTPEQSATPTTAFADKPAQEWTPFTTLPTEYTPEPQPVSLAKNTTTDTATPPSWDPLGVAPFAWDLPEPGRPFAPLPPPRTSSHFTSTVIGLAIIASALVIAVGTVTGSALVTVPRVAAVALTVVGVGLLVGAVTRRGYGLLVVAAPLAGLVVVSSLVSIRDLEAPSVGNVNAAPTTTATLLPYYESGLGNVTLDLTSLDLTEDRSVRVENAIGNTEVLLAPTTNVLVRCSTAAGNVSCLGDGVTVDGGSDGVDGPVLTLDASSALGNVEVRRG